MGTKGYRFYVGTYIKTIVGYHVLEEVRIHNEDNTVSVPRLLIDRQTIVYIHPEPKPEDIFVSGKKKNKPMVSLTASNDGVLQGSTELSVELSNRKNLYKTMLDMRTCSATWDDIANYLNTRAIPTLSGKARWTGPNTRLAFLSLKKMEQEISF